MTDQLTTDALMFLQKRLRERMNDLADHMAGGGCKNFPDYTHCVGKVAAYAEAERELIDLQQRLLDE